MHLFVGPLSKNIVDTAIEFSQKNPQYSITFIPSRRQIDSTGGYVNGWTTKTFAAYVKGKVPSFRIERDHGGPEQGSISDDGVESLLSDAVCLDILHIDPWKAYKNLDAGIDKTLELIKLCNAKNPELEYEVGTEEAIRRFHPEEVDYMIKRLRNELPNSVFSKIRYVVIQCGTALCEMKNVGHFDTNRLHKMIAVVQSYGLIPKEHNGDWVPHEKRRQKLRCGLKNINIAPELAGIESQVILNAIKKTDMYEYVYTLCLESKMWKKWVGPSFQPEANKDLLILSCLHYLYSDSRFLSLKQSLPGIDFLIQSALYRFLVSLYDIYTIRNRCVACDCESFETWFPTDFTNSLSLAFTETPSDPIFMPFNVLLCKKCKTAQTKYLGNLEIIYSKNHADNHGSLKVEMQDLFAKFVRENPRLNGILEFGACNIFLSSRIQAGKDLPYYIAEPSFTGDRTGVTIISDYAENVDLKSVPVNTIVMSHLFEHLYEPMKLLEKISACPSIEYIYLNHPDFEYNVRNQTYVVLNSEHTFYMEHSVLIAYFERFGFFLQERKDYQNHSLFLCFKRGEAVPVNEQRLVNYNVKEDLTLFFSSMQRIILALHTFIHSQPEKKFYMWPASAHSISLFACGFDTNLLTALLDNSPNKIGKYLHSYNLYCESFTKIVEEADPSTVILIGGAGQYIKDIAIANPKVKFVECTSLI